MAGAGAGGLARAGAGAGGLARAGAGAGGLAGAGRIVRYCRLPVLPLLILAFFAVVLTDAESFFG